MAVFACLDDVRKELEHVLLRDMSPRKKTSVVIRLLVYLRDELRCVYCSADFTGRNQILTLDHLVPKSEGGREHIDNLVACCRKCNQRKADRLFCAQSRQVLRTMIFRNNRGFLRRLSLSPKAMEALDASLALVVPAKRVHIFWDGQEYAVVSWTDHFILRNIHTGAFTIVRKPDTQHVKQTPEERAERQTHLAKYHRLERIMEMRDIAPLDINGCV